MSVHTALGTWVVPPHRAVWIPADARHGIQMIGRVSVRTLFFVRTLSRPVPAECVAVNVPPLLRELVLHVARIAPLYDDIAAHARLTHVVLDQVEELPAVPLQLPLPSDPRAKLAAAVLVEDVGRRRSLESVARIAGASRRTLERLFLRETHMTLGRWRQRARLIESIQQLSKGRSVTRVAFEVGYRSPSAFVAAFRRELGITPGRYFDPKVALRLE